MTNTAKMDGNAKKTLANLMLTPLTRRLLATIVEGFIAFIILKQLLVLSSVVQTTDQRKHKRKHVNGANWLLVSQADFNGQQPAVKSSWGENYQRSESVLRLRQQPLCFVFLVTEAQQPRSDKTKREMWTRIQLGSFSLLTKTLFLTLVSVIQFVSVCNSCCHNSNDTELFSTTASRASVRQCLGVQGNWTSAQITAANGRFVKWPCSCTRGNICYFIIPFSLCRGCSRWGRKGSSPWCSSLCSKMSL